MAYYSKYKAKRCEIDGIKFMSKKEASRYLELKEELEKGNITNLELQKKFVLQPSFKKNGNTYREISYICDFYYYKDGEEIIEDVKSNFTEKDKVFLLKKKMFEYKYKDLEITIVK